MRRNVINTLAKPYNNPIIRLFFLTVIFIIINYKTYILLNYITSIILYAPMFVISPFRFFFDIVINTPSVSSEERFIYVMELITGKFLLNIL